MPVISPAKPTRTGHEIEVPEPNPPLTLDTEPLEERIAPGISINRCETLVSLGAELMEERIAPGITINRCETILGEL